MPPFFCFRDAASTQLVGTVVISVGKSAQAFAIPLPAWSESACYRAYEVDKAVRVLQGISIQQPASDHYAVTFSCQGGFFQSAEFIT